MIRLAILLLGVDFLRRRWLALGVTGALWILLGVAIWVDAIDGVHYFPLRVFAIFLLIEGLIPLFFAATGLAAHRRLLYVRGLLFVLIGILVLIKNRDGDFVLAMLFGVVFTIGGALRIVAAHVVRFPGWRSSVVAGVVELILAVMIFVPWPTHYLGTVSYCLGVGFFLTGWGLIRLELTLRRLPPTGSLSMRQFGKHLHDPPDVPLPAPADLPRKLIIRVWTAVGTATDPLRRPIVDRYLAAVDGHGTVSTGHAVLDMLPDVYISHYPAEEMIVSPGEFRQRLLATEVNNVAGRFQPSYAVESADWCPCTETVVFYRFNAERLRGFWQAYRQDNTYNLTSRNCSSVAAQALEAALEGVMGDKRGGILAFARLLMTSELWIASEIYHRATTMAWTPGLVLDYSRALRAIIHPRPVTLPGMLRLATIRARQARRRMSMIGADPSAGGAN